MPPHLGHLSAVRCCAISPENNVFCTGGDDDFVRVWVSSFCLPVPFCMRVKTRAMQAFGKATRRGASVGTGAQGKKSVLCACVRDHIRVRACTLIPL